jgi:predicted nuclease of predicted toxin-antitoxin system
MNFIVDAQLPKLISDLLNAQGHDCIHTIDLPNKNRTTDKQIIEISKREQRIVVTKDADFLNSFLVNNQPKKLILIKTGNIPNSVLLHILQTHLDNLLKNLLYHSLIEINQTEMIVHE